MTNVQHVAGSKAYGPSGRSVANKAKGQLLFEVSSILPRGWVSTKLSTQGRNGATPSTREIRLNQRLYVYGKNYVNITMCATAWVC